MKIAAISDDGINISQHFGRASLYVVVTAENGKIISKESRAKAGHHSFANLEQHDFKPGERHGYDTVSQNKHARMAESISDCQVLLAGGMGWGAYESMQSYNIKPVITDVSNIDKAVKLYLSDRLESIVERLH
jgi:predicted Fe-Mo cluster-binding NifX family protein